MAKKDKIYNWAYIDNNMVILTESNGDSTFNSETRIMINSISSVSKVKVVGKINKVLRIIGCLLILVAIGVILKSTLSPVFSSISNFKTNQNAYEDEVSHEDAFDDEDNDSVDSFDVSSLFTPSKGSIIISVALAILGILLIIISAAWKSCTMLISCSGDYYFVGIGSDNTEELYSQLVGILYYRR